MYLLTTRVIAPFTRNTETVFFQKHHVFINASGFHNHVRDI